LFPYILLSNTFVHQEGHLFHKKSSSLYDDRALEFDDEESAAMPPLHHQNIESASNMQEPVSIGLSDFIFLNPRWLVAAVACILVRIIFAALMSVAMHKLTLLL